MRQNKSTFFLSQGYNLNHSKAEELLTQGVQWESEGGWWGRGTSQMSADLVTALSPWSQHHLRLSFTPKMKRDTSELVSYNDQESLLATAGS